MGIRSGKAGVFQQQRRDEALVRQMVWDAKSVDEKLQIIANRRGKSTRETARLLAIKEQQEEARKKSLEQNVPKNKKKAVK